MIAELENEVISDVTEQEIREVFKAPEEIERAKMILRQAEEESLKKEIIITRKVRPLYNKLSKLRWMFYYGIHWSKPFYPFRLARNILLSRYYVYTGKKKFVLRGCEFDITFKCNFTCSHCSTARLDKDINKKILEPEDYKNIVKQAMKLGATSFGLEGGEPFMNKDWGAIIEACRGKYNHILISTNGWLFNEKTAKKCSELGVDTINFSLDNGIPEIHDLFRKKKGSFDRVMNAIKLCRKYGIKVIINTVVHKHNLYTEGFRRILEFGDREKIMIHCLFAKSIGNFKGNSSMLDSEDFKAFDKIVEPYPYAFVHHDTQAAYGAHGCNGTKEMMQFTPYGDTMNCANMHIYFGNVREESLADIRNRALKETPFGEYRPCFLALDEDFMNVYYTQLERKSHLNINEFSHALRQYEKKHDKVVYPELHN